MNGTVVFLEPKGTVLEVIRAAKERGYRVVALSSDRSLLDAAPGPYRSAVPLIDQVLAVESWLGLASITGLCEAVHRESPIVGIYSGVDSCAAVLTRLRLRYGLPSPTPDQTELVLNKYRLRKRLRELGLSGLQSLHSSEISDLRDWPFQGTAYFKPVQGFASAYVRRCASLAELDAARSLWEAGSANDPKFMRDYLRATPEYHVEEAIEGELLSVEAIASGGKLHVLGLLSRILYSKDPVIEMGSCFPYPHPLADRIVDLVERAHAALGLTDGPTHTEVIVGQGGKIEIIDLNPRFVGADVLQSINSAYGIRIQEALLDYALGSAPCLSPNDRGFACLQYFFPPVVPVLDGVKFPNAPEVKFQTTYMDPGSRISNTNRQIDYLGCYLTVMPSFAEALLRSLELRKEVRVNREFEGVF